MKKTIIYLIFIIFMALSLGILTGCVQKEENKQNDESNKENSGNNINIVVADENEVSNEVEEKNIEKLSQIEAKKIVKEKFELAIECYGFGLYDYDSSEYVAIPEMGNTNFIIKNFDEVTSAFTEKGKQDLLQNQGLIFEYQGEYYLGLGGIAEYFSDYELIDVDVEEEKIQGTFKVDVSVGEEVIVNDKEIPFVIVLEDGKWLIDEYIDVADVENYN